MKHFGRIALLIAAALSCNQAHAELLLPSVLSNNMVLQRGKETRIWGKGTEGVKVAVRFKQQLQTTVVKDGKWLLKLDAEPAGGPFEMVVSSGDDKKVLKNILVGEVWVASGQSNMQWSLAGATHGEEAINAPTNAQIRLFKQDRVTAAEPVFDVPTSRWRIANAGARKNFSAVAYYFAQDLQNALGVPVGVILVADGGTRTQYWTPLWAFQQTPGFETAVDEARQGYEGFDERRKKFDDALAELLRKRKAGEKSDPVPPYYGRVHCAYYNGMVHPIENCTVRGAIWYQGERNSMTTEEAFEYRRYFPLMIQSWRKLFRDPELPFFFVQLPKMSPRNVRDLPTVRESQLLTSLNTPHTAMVVTIDVGEDLGLHPALKRPIGLRLATLARAKVYGEELEHSAPVFKRAEVQGEKVIVHFAAAASELVSSDGKPLREFTICGPDHKFAPAHAEIRGKTIVVTGKTLPPPVAVRYAWKKDPQGNLASKGGLPVSPFRTDSFKLVNAVSSLTASAEKPNIVVIFIDDLGYGDIGPFGSTHQTPQLDRMAKEGMKLTDFYVSSSACTPSRAALMTGCYADRIGMGASVVFPADKRGLNPSEITIAEILKQGGYATGCFGKWHLGDHPSFMPNNQGFDEYEGIPYSNDMWVPNKRRMYPPLPWMKQGKPVAHIPDAASQAVLTDAITDAAVDFIRRHNDEPFFAYVSHSAVHAPFMTKPERLAAAGDDVMAALISEVDNSVGRILQTLRELDFAENTFVLFTNDNGGGGKTSPGPLRGAKFGPKYEGHMRVATLAWWPGKVPAGSVSSEIMTTTDVLPTIARFARQPVPADRISDGKDVSDILLGKADAKSPHETLYYEDDGIRQGKWKLVHYRVKADWFTELYDLEADLGEKNNIADQHPDVVKALKASLDAHAAEVEKNSRPAAFVENPKPLLSDASGLPTLAEYVSGNVGQASSLPTD